MRAVEQLRRKTYLGPDGRKYDLSEAMQPALEPGQTLTTVPPYWCEGCARARAVKRCSVCGQRTVERAELEHDPAAAAVEALAELQGVARDLVDVTVEQLEPGSQEALQAPPDPAELEHSAAVYAATLPASAPDEAPPELELEPDGAPELEQPKRLNVLERLTQQRIDTAAAPRGDRRLLGRTYREQLIMTRPKAPMSRGVTDRVRPAAAHPMRDDSNPTRTRHQMQPAQRSKEIDDRGREVQRTLGRSKRGSIEDKLLKLWESANIDRTMWSGFLSAALQRLVPNEAGELEPISVEEAAEIADACYIQLLMRDNAATGG